MATTNLGMKVLVGTDNIRWTDLNYNFNEIDTKFGAHNHDGSIGNGPKIQWTNLSGVPQNATTEEDGFMSTDDKSWIDNIRSGYVPVEHAIYSSSADYANSSNTSNSADYANYAGIISQYNDGVFEVYDDELTIKGGGVTDVHIGNRTVNDSNNIGGSTGVLGSILNTLGNMIKSITGKANWYTAPVTSIQALDDRYQEGTFTPTVYGGTTAGSPAYSMRLGRYIRNGKMCTVHMHITISGNISSIIGSVLISGLPFQAKSEIPYQFLNVAIEQPNISQSEMGSILLKVNSGSSSGIMVVQTKTNWSSLLRSDVGTDGIETNIIVHGTYYIQ